MQGFDATKPATITQVASAEIRRNFEALSSCNAGTVPPSEPLDGMLWLDTSGSTPYLRQYYSGGWNSIITSGGSVPSGLPWFDIKSYGAIGDGVNDDTSAIQAAISAASIVNGCVLIPSGTFLFSSTLTIPDKTMLMGVGRWGSTLKYSGIGTAIRLFATVMSTLSDFRLEVATAATGTAILMMGSGIGGSGWCQFCTLRDLELCTESGMAAGQQGLVTSGSLGQVVYSSISNIVLINFDRPVVYGANCEANVFHGIHVSGFGAGSTGTGFEVNGDNSSITGIWMGRGGSTATLTGFAGSGEKNIIDGLLDIGTAFPGVTANLTGANPLVRVISIGNNFTAGTVGAQAVALGEKVDASTYLAYVMAKTGANKDIFSASVSGYSNGFAVNYQNSPQAMKYSFDAGSVGVGCDPGFGGTSLYVRGPNPWYDVKANGGKGDDSTDDTAVIQACIDSANVTGGTVFFPAGVYKTTATLNHKQGVRLVGAGRRASYIKCYGNTTAIKLTGTQYSTIANLSVLLADTGSSAKGIWLINSPGVADCCYNTFNDIEVWGNGLHAGQQGLRIEATGGGITVFNHFNDFIFYDICEPMVCQDDEANSFVNFHMVGAGTGASGSFVQYAGHADQFTNFWFGRGSSTATTLYGFYGSGDTGVINCIADIGAGQAVELVGSGNIVKAVVLGVTTYGRPGAYSGITTHTGQYRESSLYDLCNLGVTGQDEYLFQSGVSGYSNGFTVDYDHSPQKMIYTFANGDVTLTTGNVVVGGAWDSGHIVMGSNHIWTDGAGKARIKSGAPASDTDGTIIGAQS
jgi:hypothetical protein